MAEPPPLELDNDPGWERTWPVIESVLVALLSLFVLAGLAGLLGKGPLSKAQAQLPGLAATVTYERLARNDTPADLTVQWKGAPAARLAQITLDRSLLDALTVTDSTPRAVAAAPLADGVAWFFPVAPEGGQVTFHVQPRRPGPANGRLGLFGRAVPLNFFVFP